MSVWQLLNIVGFALTNQIHGSAANLRLRALMADRRRLTKLERVNVGLIRGGGNMRHGSSIWLSLPQDDEVL